MLKPCARSAPSKATKAIAKSSTTERSPRLTGSRGAGSRSTCIAGPSARRGAGTARVPPGEQLERAPSELAARLVAIGAALHGHALGRTALAHPLDVIEHGLHR